MRPELTEELLEQLLEEPHIEGFLNDATFNNVALPEMLQILLDKYGKSKADIVHSTTINDTHAYQIFGGDRGASRDKVLQLALAIGCTVKESNHLLNSAGVSELYCKNRRDAIIIFCIKESYSVYETNDVLYKFNEDTLS